MLYLIRHADAVSEEENHARPLSAKGRDQVRAVCAALRARGGFEPAEVWHSPLVRSRQTAEFLVGGLGLSAPLVLKDGLEPDENPEAIARALDAETREIAVVGHEPHLGVLAGLLVEGPSKPPFFFPFPKAGVLGLLRKGKRWKSEWLVRKP
jgi:phosphohistidine phosphatase